MIIYMIMITHESVLISILSQLWRGLNPLFSSNHYKELHDKIHLMLSPVHVVCMSLVIVCVCVCVCVCVFQGVGETVLHREHPRERAVSENFSARPDNLARCKL